MLNSYKDLTAWQKSVRLVKEIYLLTEKFPKTERFGLTSQIRRAAVAIPANIAEGYTRKHRKEYAQFVRISYGSGAELETELMLSKELGFVQSKDFLPAESLLKEVMAMLNKLIASLEKP